LLNRKVWARKRRKNVEKRKEVAEDNWLTYFHSIKNVCPWSYESYKKGRIYITEFTENKVIKTEQNWNCVWYDAVVYLTDMSVDELDEFVEERNRKQHSCEYLWSHPEYTKGGNRQTSQPIIIQQDRAFLTELRGKKRGSQKKKKKSH